MSTGASQQGTGGTGSDEVNGVAPLADDRPYVDGTAVSAEDLRAEVERLSNEDRQHVDDLREEVGDSLAELKARFDVKARVAERKEEAVAAVHQHVDRARHVAVDRAAFAQQPSNGIKRTILQRADEPGAPNYEAVMAIAEIAPGASSGRHRHPGIELAYVLEGSLVLEREGQQPVTLKAGDALKNEAAVHNAKNIGKKPVKILAVYLVEKGKPMAETVP